VSLLRELVTMIDTWERQSDIPHVSVDLAGEFDAYDLEPLCEVLDGLLDSRGTTCVDLSGVTFLDLRCARELATRSELCGGHLVLRNPSWQAVSSLRACGYGYGSLRSELESPGV
jgi:anti-anti-sigma regulatory factor